MFDRIHLAGLVLLVTGGFSAAPAAAEDRKFETPAGVVVVDIDSQWRSTQPTAEGMSGIAFETGPGGRSMHFMLVTGDEVENDTFTAAEVRKLTEQLRESEATGGKTVTEIRDLAGGRVSGYYFQVNGVPGAVLRAGEYKWMISGILVTRSTPLFFTVAWSEDGKAAADRAFAAVRGLRFADR